MRIPQSQNSGFGFHGSIETYLHTWAAPGSTTADAVWNATFPLVAAAAPFATPEMVRAFLDSPIGRHMFDETTNYLPSVGYDEDKKTNFTLATMVDAVKKTLATSWVKKKLAPANFVKATGIDMREATDWLIAQAAKLQADEPEDAASFTAIAAALSGGNYKLAHKLANKLDSVPRDMIPSGIWQGALGFGESVDSGSDLSEDAHDVVMYLNPNSYVQWGSLGDVDRTVVTRIESILQSVVLDRKTRAVVDRAVVAAIKKDKQLMRDLAASKGKLLKEHTETNYESDEIMDVTDAEFVFETEDGELIVDHADLMEDLVIDALEEAVAEAVATDPNAHVAAARQLDAMLDEGDYEAALHFGCSLLRRAGVDESRIEEFKQGFKVSAGRRAAMARKRAKPKTGTAMMALRKRRRMAKKSSAKMKRARYYKRNRVRIARRRKQLSNSVVVPSNEIVQEMLDAGFPFVILLEGADALFAADQESADELAASQEGSIVEATDLLEGRVTIVEASADDEEDDEEDYEDDEETDDEEDDPDEEEPDDDEDDMEEAVDESLAPAAFATQVAKFIVANPKVTYGELATHFGIGRDVAQQFLLLHQFGSMKDRGSYLALAKEILGSMKTFQAGAKNLSASIEDDGANLIEADDEEPDPFSEPSKLGAWPKGSRARRKRRYAPKTNGKKTGVPKPGTKLPPVKFKGQDGAVKDDHCKEDHVDITVPRERTEALLAAAKDAGLKAESTTVRVSGGTLTLRVPSAVADQIRQALSA